jgi:hydrogenase nickel incorporation protein HypA/HybF
MHEYAVASNIVELVLEKSLGRRVEKVNLSVGALSGIFTESLTMYLILILEEKGHLGVKIETQKASATFKCDCGKEYTASKMTNACPSCGGYNRLIIWGKDCVVESIEVSDD